jgi:hypothetical protein
MMAVLIYGLTLFLSPDGTGSGHAILDIPFFGFAFARTFV